MCIFQLRKWIRRKILDNVLRREIYAKLRGSFLYHTFYALMSWTRSSKRHQSPQSSSRSPNPKTIGVTPLVPNMTSPVVLPNSLIWNAQQLAILQQGITLLEQAYVDGNTTQWGEIMQVVGASTSGGRAVQHYHTTQLESWGAISNFRQLGWAL